MERNIPIPTIDCSKILSPLDKITGTEDFADFVKQLGDVMSGVGFAYLINHETEQEKIDKALAQSREFFALPPEVKGKYRKLDAVENFHGYSAASDEILNERDKGPKETKECFDFWGKSFYEESAYPEEVPGWKKAFEDFRESLASLAEKILRAFALYLKLDDQDYFIKHHRAFLSDKTVQSHNVCRANHYFSLENLDDIPDDTMRLTEHQDWGTITFLYQDDVGGLEAKMTNGDWAPVTPIKGSLVLNAGLMLEMWSGGLFPATAHRVRLLKESAGKTRQSMAFFLQPDADANCCPVVEEQLQWQPLYPKFTENETHFDYFRERVRRTRAY